jgi:Secretion system C-terminal sorting domain/Right handed beta helix region
MKSILTLLLAFCCLCGFAQTYYVDAATGSNTNTGTSPAQAWKTIQYAANTIPGGATVIIAGGTYNEQITIPATKSGTAAQRTVFQSAPGATVIVEGGVVNTNAAVVNGTNTNRFQSQFKINGASYVTISGIKVQNAQWYGISAEDGANYAIIDNCKTFNTGASGIYAKTSTNIEITYNDVQKACQVLTRGSGNSGTQECISIVGVDYFKVSHNEISNSTVPDTAGGEGIDAKGGSKYGEISYNYIHDIEPLGVYIDAGSFGSGLPCYLGGASPAMSDIRVFGNKIVNTNGVGIAGELGGEAKDIYFYNNIIKDSKKIGFVFNIPGSDLVCAGNAVNPIPKTTVGKYTNIYVVNNVFYNNALADITSNSKNTANSKLVIQNNIFYNKSAAFIRTFRFDLFTPFTVDHNLYYDFKASTQSITPGATDVNLLDPLFTNSATNTFSIPGTSPAVSKAIPIYLPNAPGTLMFTTDFYGNPRGTSNWDMGIYETQGALPVTLTEFKGYNEGTANRLVWKTSAEVNNAGFEVERSANGLAFSKLAAVKSQSGDKGSNEQLSYGIEDPQPLRSLTYYRLKQIDFDGTFSYSRIIAVQSAIDNQLNLYPNPANNFVFLDLGNTGAEIELHDVSGRIIFTQTATKHLTKIDLSKFKSGIYFLKITDKDNGVQTQKIIKE